MFSCLKKRFLFFAKKASRLTLLTMLRCFLISLSNLRSKLVKKGQCGALKHSHSVSCRGDT